MHDVLDESFLFHFVNVLSNIGKHNHPDQKGSYQRSAQCRQDIAGFPGQRQADNCHAAEQQHAQKDGQPDQLGGGKGRLFFGALELGGGKKTCPLSPSMLCTYWQNRRNASLSLVSGLCVFFVVFFLLTDDSLKAPDNLS